MYLFESTNLREDYKPIGKCAGHSSFITHLDFSDDGKVSLSQMLKCFKVYLMRHNSVLATVSGEMSETRVDGVIKSLSALIIYRKYTLRISCNIDMH